MTSPYAFRCGLEDDTIVVKLAPSETQYCEQDLKIRFVRTIRVPDNVGEARLPYSLGHFPLSSVRDFASNLPREVATKAGVFFPVYQQEAMRIEFLATRPFMVEVYTGSVNAVSGEHKTETQETWMRRVDLVSKKKSIQDYVVAPRQLWLGGYAVSPGIFRQFVATPLRTAYSAATETTEQEIVNLQLEITPSIPEIYPASVKVYPPCTPSQDFSIIIQTLTRKAFPIYCSPTDTIRNVKQSISNAEGIPPEFQMLSSSQVAFDDLDQTLNDCGVENTKNDNTPDSWAKNSTITMPVHIMTTKLFRQVTEQSPLPCPISASTYEKAGLPVFDFPEKPNAISLGEVKSVSTTSMDGKITGEPMVLTIRPRDGALVTQSSVDRATIEDPDGLINPDGPY